MTMISVFPGLSREQSLALSVAVIKSNRDAVIVIDSYGKVIEWLGKAEPLFGYTRQEAIGRLLENLIIPEDKKRAHKDALAKRRETGTESEVSLWIEIEALNKKGRKFMVELSIEYVHAESSVPDKYYVARIRDISEQKADQNRILMLNRAAHHEIGNIFAIILAIIKRSKSLADAVDRIIAMSKSHMIIRNANDAPVSLLDIVKSEAEIYKPNLLYSGPDIMLKASAAKTLGMCIHEMTTNAVKHGSLFKKRFWSKPGQVHFTWHIDNDELVMNWIETGGPTLDPDAPRKKGLGSKLIKLGLEIDLGGKMTYLEYNPKGLIGQNRIPLINLI